MRLNITTETNEKPTIIKTFLYINLKIIYFTKLSNINTENILII